MSGPGTRAATTPGAHGFVTLQFVVAAALSLVLLVLVANVLVAAYARAAVRAALDEGARAGARADAVAAECIRRAHDVLDDLLGGPLRAGVGDVTCSADDRRVHAAVHVTGEAWLPGVPAWSYTAAAVTTREPAQ
jgi:hypothetical protein